MKHLSWIVLLLTISTFSQTPGGGVTDIDGNLYNSVIIGTQEWMKENLNVSKYSDGTIIPQVTDPTQWANLTTSAWCYYNNDPTNGPIYGKLYNWYAVAGIYDAASLNNPALRKQLVPNGWHVPSNQEWITLINYLDPTAVLPNQNIAGGAMKSTSTILWNSPNTSATNSSGFTGLPGGYRDHYNGTFNNIGFYGNWWSSSVANTTDYWYNFLSFEDGQAYRNNANGHYFRTVGFSVRCLGDSSLSSATIEINSLKLYPNPVVRVLNIKTDNNLLNQPYSIIDGLGRTVLNGKLNEVDTTINVEQLSKGIYYLKVSGYSATKFIKH
jgi:uncharacterized protein (TIGR02145 family)